MSIDTSQCVCSLSVWQGRLLLGTLLLAVSGCGKILGFQDTQLAPDMAGDAGVGDDAAVAPPATGGGGDRSAGGATLGADESAGAPSGVGGASDQEAGGASAVGGADTAGQAGAPEAGAGGYVPRIPVGAIVSHSGTCLAVAAMDGGGVEDSTAVLRSCADDPAERWSRDADEHLAASGVNDAFLTAPDDVGDRADSVGAEIWVAPLDTITTSQAWLFDGVYLVNDGGLCVDVPLGNFKSGAAIQLFKCHAGAAQKWTLSPTGLIRHGNWCFDLPNDQTADGTLVEIYACKDPPETNQQFTLVHGRIQLYGGKCLGVVGDATISETPLQIMPCPATTDGRPQGLSFRANGPIMNQGRCLEAEVASGSSAVGLSPCSANAVGQAWDYYF
jgi:ricin-type beta-trefoil lectin protein